MRLDRLIGVNRPTVCVFSPLLDAKRDISIATDPNLYVDGNQAPTP